MLVELIPNVWLRLLLGIGWIAVVILSTVGAMTLKSMWEERDE